MLEDPVSYYWIPLSSEVKPLGREADHSPPSNTEVKRSWSYDSVHLYLYIVWCFSAIISENKLASP
jgi:hypothetical protein